MPDKIKDYLDFGARLAMIMHEAHKLGLHITGHALHEAVRKVGYEIADKIEKKK